MIRLAFSAEGRRFDLLGLFLRVGLLTVVVLVFAASRLSERYVYQQTVRPTEREVVLDARQAATAFELRYRQLTGSLAAGIGVLDDGQAAGRAVGSVPQLTGAARVRVWDARGRVLHSTDPQEIGGREPTSVSLARALRGGELATLRRGGLAELGEAAEVGWTWDVWAPVRGGGPAQGPAEPVVGALQIYWPIAATTAAELEGATRQLRMIMWGSLAFLVGALLLTVGQGQRVIEGTANELHRAQQRLLRAERMLAIGRLGATLAHELRNAMGVMANSAHYLRSMASSVLLPEQERLERHTVLIQQQIERSNQLLSRVVVFANRLAPRHERCELATLVQDALAGKEVPPSIRLQLDTRAGRAAEVDPALFRTALEAVLQNAIEAMPRGGELEIRTVEAEDGLVGVSVADSGPGIPADQVEHVFEALYTTKELAMGLGLPLTRSIIEAHDGRVELETAEGKGTRVVLLAPAWSPQGELAPREGGG